MSWKPGPEYFPMAETAKASGPVVEHVHVRRAPPTSEKIRAYKTLARNRAFTIILTYCVSGAGIAGVGYFTAGSLGFLRFQVTVIGELVNISLFTGVALMIYGLYQAFTFFKASLRNDPLIGQLVEIQEEDKGRRPIESSSEPPAALADKSSVLPDVPEFRSSARDDSPNR